jgi:hypothetical protein
MIIRYLHSCHPYLSAASFIRKTKMRYTAAAKYANMHAFFSKSLATNYRRATFILKKNIMESKQCEPWDERPLSSFLSHDLECYQVSAVAVYHNGCAAKLFQSWVTWPQIQMVKGQANIQVCLQNCEKLLLASLCLSVCLCPAGRPSVHPPHGTTRLPLDGFWWDLIFELFSKICHENSSFIQTRLE